MDVKEVLQSLDIPIAPPGHHHTTSAWTNIDCPFCGKGSKRFHLGISNEHFNCSCWRCGPKRLWETLAEASGRPVFDVGRVCAGLTRVRQKTGAKLRGKLALPAGVGELRPVHRRYLKARRLDPEAVKDLWGVGGIGLAARLSWRLFIPVRLDGEVVSWTTRSLSDSHEGRYVSASLTEEAVPHKEVLYGEEYATHTLVIQEGPIDVWALGPGSVCTFGTGWTPAQLLRMAAYRTRVVLFDDEPHAQRQARKLVNDLSVFEGETFNVTFSTGKDASRASRRELTEFRKRFMP